MDLSIIIVNWNTKELLAQCLESVATSFGRPRSTTTSPLVVRSLESVSYELYVVDNASTDGSAQMVRERFPEVHLVENVENAGFASANNQAIHQSTGQYVLLLNSDTKVHPGALETMVEFMAAHPQAGGCGARLLNADGSLQASCHPMLTPAREFWRLLFLDRVWHRATYAQGRWDQKISYQVDVIKGACLLLRRAALDKVGLLDDGYFMYTEEMDLCYRLLRAGWELWWVPQAAVVHYGEASSKQVAEAMYIELYRSKVRFHRKFGGSRRASRFKRLMFLAYAPRLIVTALGALLFSSYAARRNTYRRLLAELPRM